MRNETPHPIRCAVCNCTGRQSLFRRPGAKDMNWVEAHGGTYMVCNAHIDSVYVTEDFSFPHGVRFSATPTLRDLERRIEDLEQGR